MHLHLRIYELQAITQRAAVLWSHLKIRLPPRRKWNAVLDAPNAESCTIGAEHFVRIHASEKMTNEARNERLGHFR
jgi:hypothetical protein